MTIRLHTPRLILRRLEYADAPALHQLCSDIEVARDTIHIPHPYPPGAAEAYIAATHDALVRGTAFHLVIQCHEKIMGDDRAVGDDKGIGDDQIIGCAGLDVEHEHRRAELGYWIGKAFWGQGFATEAARRMVAFGFGGLGLHRVYATCFTRNAASARVLVKLGMRHEGTFRQHMLKYDDYLDVHSFGILRAEYEAIQHQPIT